MLSLSFKAVNTFTQYWLTAGIINKIVIIPDPNSDIDPDVNVVAGIIERGKGNNNVASTSFTGNIDMFAGYYKLAATQPFIFESKQKRKMFIRPELIIKSSASIDVIVIIS